MTDEKKGIRVRRSKAFKLKNLYNKNFQVIHLKDFGFVPETLLFERNHGNWFTISAVLTPEMIKKEDEKNDINPDTTKN